MLMNALKQWMNRSFMRELAFRSYLVLVRTADNVEIQIDVALVNDSKALKQGDFTC